MAGDRTASGSNACANCGATSEGAFCSTCGQPIDVDPRSLRYWVRNVLGELLSLDGTLPRSLVVLVTRPGLLAVEWRQGRRASWSQPFRLYLLSSVLFLGLALITEGSLFSFTVEYGVPDDPFLADAVEQSRIDVAATAAPQILIALVPVLALLLKGFLAPKILYVEHLVHAFHIQAVTFFGFSLVLVLPLLLPEALEGWILSCALLAILTHAAASCRRVYGLGRILTVGKTGAVAFVFLSLSAALFAVVGVFVAPDPLEARTSAEARYAVLEAALARGDSAAAVRLAEPALIELERMEAHLQAPQIHARAAHALLLMGRTAEADVRIDQTILSAPDDPITLGVAARVAAVRGDSTAVASYATRLLGLTERAGSGTTDGYSERDEALLERLRAEAQVVAMGARAPG